MCKRRKQKNFSLRIKKGTNGYLRSVNDKNATQQERDENQEAKKTKDPPRTPAKIKIKISRLSISPSLPALLSSNIHLSWVNLDQAIPGLLKISSQFTSNRIHHNLTLCINASVSSNLLSRPKIVSTNSHPLSFPIFTSPFGLAVDAPSRWAARHMYSSHAFSNLLSRPQRRSPDSRKSSTISKDSGLRTRGRHSSARFIFPASLMRRSHRSPATSETGVAGPWWKTVQS